MNCFWNSFNFYLSRSFRAHRTTRASRFCWASRTGWKSRLPRTHRWIISMRSSSLIRFYEDAFGNRILFYTIDSLYLVFYLGAQDQRGREVHQEKQVSPALQVRRVLRVWAPLSSESEVTFFMRTIKVDWWFHLPNPLFYSTSRAKLWQKWGY